MYINSHETSSDACSCGFISSMGLPCKHIFRFRMNHGVRLFDEALILNRWKMSYFMQYLNWKEPAELGDSSSIGVLPVQRDRRQPLSQQAKYRKAFIIAQRIAALVSEATGVQFEHLLSKLLQFEDSLKLHRLSTSMQPVDIDEPDCPTFFVELRTGVHPLTPVSTEESSMDINMIQMPPPEVNSNTILDHNNVPVSTEESSIDINMIQMPPPEVNSNTILDHNNVPVSTEESSMDINMIQMPPPEVNSNTILDHNNVPVSTEESSIDINMIQMPPPEVNNNTILDHNNVPVSTEESSMDLNMIQMPPRIPRRGRPKGAETTVIGLPKKRKLATPKLLPYSKIPPADKDRMLLKWLIKPDVLPAVLIGEQLIEIADIIPWLRIPTKVTEEPVEISRVRRYFSSDSWSYLTNKLELIKKRNLWLCQACENEISGAFVICCDHCLNWYDRKCVGLKTEPKSKT